MSWGGTGPGVGGAGPITDEIGVWLTEGGEPEVAELDDPFEQPTESTATIRAMRGARIPGDCRRLGSTCAVS